MKKIFIIFIGIFLLGAAVLFSGQRFQDFSANIFDSPEYVKNFESYQSTFPEDFADILRLTKWGKDNQKLLQNHQKFLSTFKTLVAKSKKSPGLFLENDIAREDIRNEFEKTISVVKKYEKIEGSVLDALRIFSKKQASSIQCE